MDHRRTVIEGYKVNGSPYFGYLEIPKGKHPPNWTPNPRWMDIFKGRDDERVLFKTLLMTKYAGAVGGFAALFDVMLVTQSQTVTSALQRILYWNVPIIGGGLAYTSTVAVLASMRGGKNDTWNHFFGGLAAGSVCGAARHSIIFGAVLGFGFGMYGAVHKDCVLQDIDLWPDIGQQNTKRGWSLSHKEDYSVTRERRGYWKRNASDPDPPPDPKPNVIQ